MRVVGFGFRGAAEVASLQDALQHALAAADHPRIDALVTEAAKARARPFKELAALLGLPGMGITTTDLGQMITPTQSQRIVDKFGTGSLAEAAALAAAGPGAALVAQRVVSSDGMATAAIAES